MAVLAMVVLVAYSSISRYVFNKAVNFMEEVAGLLLMLACFLSFAYVFVKGGHIRVVLLLDLFPRWLRDVIEFMIRVVLVLYLALFTKLTWDFVKLSYELDCHTPDARLYEVPWMVVMPLSGAVFGVIVLISCVEALWNMISGKKGLEFEKASGVTEEETKTF